MMTSEQITPNNLPNDSTLLPDSASQTSVQMLRRQFQGMRNRAKSTHLEGSLGGSTGNSLCMPMHSPDGRSLTWQKLSNELIRKIHQCNQPQSINDCWFIEGGSTDSAGYPGKKLASRGEANKWRIHRILYFLLHPDVIPAEADKAKLQAAHRCGRGRYNFSRKINVACINPHHIELVTQSINIDQNLCRRSCAAWCPHSKLGYACIFTDNQGRYLPCRNSNTLKLCSCEPSCYLEVEQEVDTHVIDPK